MKRTNVKKTVVMIVTMFTAIVTYSQQTAGDYQKKIEELNKEMTRYMLEGNIEKNLSMYTEDAISMPSNEPMREGIAEIRKNAEEMVKMGMKVNSFETTIKKVIPAGNLITEIGNYKIKVSIPGQEQPVEDHGKYLTIWEKQSNGSLKVKVETWNSDVSQMNQTGSN
jgi:ketosteroid isomerase-like protein